MRYRIFSILLTVSALSPTLCSALHQPNFVVIIPSYNNKDWYRKNLDSIITQQYDPQKVRIIYLDAGSTDGTGELVAHYLKEKNIEDRVTLIRRPHRYCSLENIYDAHYMSDDESVAMVVDGDDWLAHPQVFAKLASVYADPNVWMTYGQFTHFPGYYPSPYGPVSNYVISRNSFRTHPWTTSHLRTSYVWLFKCIDKESLMLNGKFFPSSGDQAYMFPLLELAGFHSRFIPDILYVYNVASPLNDNKQDPQLQRDCEAIIRARAPHQPLKERPISRTEQEKKKHYHIGFLVMATGKYDVFIPQLINSIRAHVLPEHKKTFFVFSDGSIPADSDIVRIEQKRLGWPLDTLMRFEVYHAHRAAFAECDYLFAIDADMRFVAPVAEEILSDLVGTTHPGYYQSPRSSFTYETNPHSTAAIKPNEGTHYFAGGFYGGTYARVIELFEHTIANIKQDFAQGLIAIWHDESHLNRYFVDNPPTKRLPVEYCVPEELQYQYPPAKLLALHKRHADFRKS